MNTNGVSFIRLGIIDEELVQTIVLRDDQNEFIIAPQAYTDTEIIDVQLDNSMEKIELVINGVLQQIMPYPLEENGYGLTIDNQFFMLADSSTAPPLIVSMPVNQFCLNEIANSPESQQIAVEIHGNVTAVSYTHLRAHET